MFQFPGFASRNLFYSVKWYSDPNYLIRRLDNRDEWVSPFGNLRVKGCSHLTAAYRSVPRPSSPVHAKASTNCPYLTLESPHHQWQRWIGLRRHETRQEQRRMVSRCGWLISARFKWLNRLRASTNRPKPVPKPQSRYHHGIDFKNPFTMSKTEGFAFLPGQGPDLVSSSSGYAERRARLRRQSRQSCALWRASQRWPCLSMCETASLLRLSTAHWWSLSGSNRWPDACKATALPAELRPPTKTAGNGGPSRSWTYDLTLIRRAL